MNMFSRKRKPTPWDPPNLKEEEIKSIKAINRRENIKLIAIAFFGLVGVILVYDFFTSPPSTKSVCYTWSKATDQERLDVNNGLLLSPTYDALFDKHLITFDNKGKIQLSDKIEFFAYQKIGVTGKEQIDDLSMYNVQYLERHNQSFF